MIASLCALGGLAHLIGIVLGAGLVGLQAWVFAGMALACLLCAAHLARSRSRSALGMTVAMAAVMLVAHLGYLIALAPAFGGDVGHGHLAAGASATLVTASAGAASAHEAHGGALLGVMLPMAAELAVLAVGMPVLRRVRVAGTSSVA